MLVHSKRLLTAAGAVALLLTAAACADRAVAPARSTPPSGPALGKGGASAALALENDEADTVVFTVDPTVGGKFKLASGHSLSIPANAICDRATSSYGPLAWDRPCARATQPITITAVSRKDAHGRPYVDFQPAMRFAPTSDQARWVWLFLSDEKAARDGHFQIDYCFTGLACVDESLADPTLATHRKSHDRYLYRRIKHFSGYNVAAGRAMLDSDGAVAY